MMLQLRWVSTLLVVFAIQSNLALAALQSPACSVNCTLQILEPTNCDFANLQSCLCRNNTLQNELTACVFAACNPAEQIVASEILQTEICVGVPAESRKEEILRAEIILAAFSFPIIALRLISRIWIVRDFWWDDWMIVICAIFMIPNTIIPIYTVTIGFGNHSWNFPLGNATKLGLLFWIASIFYSLIQSIAKFSILLLYLRIFPTPSFRRLVKLALAWQICHMIAFTVTIIVQCIPVRAFWVLKLPRHCVNFNAHLKAGAFASILEDLVIMFLPISELKRLHLGIRKRVALCFIFALGSFACITSMIRLRYVWNYTPTLDGAWDSVDLVIWSDIETYVAVICSCLMCIWPLVLKLFPALFSSTLQTHSSSNVHPSSTNSNTNSHRKPWAIKLGSAIKVTKTWQSEESSARMTRLGDKDEAESARKIILQRNTRLGRGRGNRDCLEGDGGIEMEERGESPGPMWRGGSEDGRVHSLHGKKS